MPTRGCTTCKGRSSPSRRPTGRNWSRKHSARRGPLMRIPWNRRTKTQEESGLTMRRRGSARVSSWAATPAQTWRILANRTAATPPRPKNVSRCPATRLARKAPRWRAVAKSTPYGSRTRVTGLRTRCPGPLDEGGAAAFLAWAVNGTGILSYPGRGRSQWGRRTGGRSRNGPGRRTVTGRGTGRLFSGRRRLGRSSRRGRAGPGGGAGRFARRRGGRGRAGRRGGIGRRSGA